MCLKSSSARSRFTVAIETVLREAVLQPARLEAVLRAYSEMPYRDTEFVLRDAVLQLNGKKLCCETLLNEEWFCPKNAFRQQGHPPSTAPRLLTLLRIKNQHHADGHPWSSTAQGRQSQHSTLK